MKHFSTTDTKLSQADMYLVHFQWEQAYYP